MSLWLDKHRPTSLTKLDYHKEQAMHLKKLVTVFKHLKYAVSIPNSVYAYMLLLTRPLSRM